MRTIILLISIACGMCSTAVASQGREPALHVALDRLWSALSNEPGHAADVTTLRELFHPEARVIGAGRDGLRTQTAEQFLTAQAKVSAEGFYEREIHRQVVAHDALAQVFSTVESRQQRDAQRPTAVGINSIQWFWDGKAWRIVSLYYQLESPATPIPSQFRN